jgi:cytochrome P450
MIQFDPLSDAFPISANEIFKEMRRSCRAFNHGTGKWQFISIFHHESIRACLSDHELWSSKLEEVETLVLGDAALLIQDDPPEHTRYKAFLLPFLSNRALLLLSDGIRAKVGQMMEQSRGVIFEFVENFAAQLSTNVICQVLGLPSSEADTIRRFTNEVSENVGLEFLETNEARLADQAERVGKVHSRFSEYLRDARKCCISSRTSGMVYELSRTDFSEREQIGLIKAIAFAGNHTSSILQSSAIWLLGTHVDQMQKLRDAPHLVPIAVEEVLRYKSTFRGSTRIATRDGDIEGVPFGRGHYLIAWTTSGNWDEAAFPHASSFDVGRNSSGHLGFGHGPHYCIGSQIARFEMQALLSALIEKNISPIIIGTPKVIRDPWVDGFEELLVCFE